MRVRVRPGSVGLAGIATAVSSLAIAAGALGAVGDLTPQGCIEDLDSDGLAGCGATAQGLEAAAAVAVSPDGASVYAVSESNDDAIVRFNRAADGALTPAGCIADVGDPAGCGVTANGLNGAASVAVSPDGASVYVASADDEAIVRFDRAPSGVLSNPSCIEDPPTDAGCASTAEGLNSAHGVAVSPGGTSVYVASFTDSAIVGFDRAPNGELSDPSCIEDPPNDAGCGGTAEGLARAQSVAVSPNGASVYAVSQDDDAIVRFDRAPSGALTNSSCIEDLEHDGVCDDVGAAGEAQGLDNVRSVAVSPDGASVYATGAVDDALVRFDRAPGGALSNPSCISDVGTGACGAATAEGLNQPRYVTVSSDSASVYAVSQNDDAIVRFDRAPGGALSNSSCIEDPEHNDSCDDVGPAGEAQGLQGASGVAVSPDGTSVYAAGTSDDAIVRLDREVPPTPPPSDGEAPDTEPPETQITGGPKNKTKKKRANFEFISTEPGSTFECGLDGKAFEPCASPDQVKVKKGKHTFQVRATDAAGNIDPTPASDAWKVRKKGKQKGSKA
jgi:DNA-binding beta-propeller fold protein YncE